MIVLLKIVFALLAFVVLLLLVGAVGIASKGVAVALPGLGLIISGWLAVMLLAVVEGLLLLALWWLFSI